MNPESILRRLIAVRSDTGTEMERDMAKLMLEIIGSDSYFAGHPEYFGAWDGGDRLGRPVVWALKRGTGRRTLVLSGHYDAVGVSNYGTLADAACDPDELARRLQDSVDTDEETLRDLKSGDWLFGRGSNDMKGGLAVNLYTLLRHVPRELNILFTAVCDEESQSEGARQAPRLYIQLRQQFDLQYIFAVVSEPSFRDVDAKAPYTIINGSAGKIMPLIMARGLLAHSARSMNGLSSTVLIAKIIDKIELCDRLVSADKGVNTHPPSVLMLRDMKETYDVSLPEYTGAALSVTYLQSTRPMDMLEQIREMCHDALEEGVRKYNDIYDTLIGRGMMPAEGRQAFVPRAYTHSELECIAKSLPGYVDFKKRALSEAAERVKCRGETLQYATMLYLMALMDFAKLPAASAVVALSPPFCAAANNDYLGGEAGEIIGRLIGKLGERGIDAAKIAYSQGMTDLSYMSCADLEGAKGIMDNIPLRNVYDIDFDLIDQAGMPTVMIGPGAKGVHQCAERVYLPDINRTLPDIFETLIELLETR